MTDDLISQKAMLDAAVRIRTAVPKKRPVAAHLLDASQIDLGQHERLVLSRFGGDDAEGIAHKRVTPEFEPIPLPTARPAAAGASEPRAIPPGNPPHAPVRSAPSAPVAPTHPLPREVLVPPCLSPHCPR